MIHTVTLNPSIDYIVHVEDLKIGEVNRMKKDLKLPGGKGINVSRILKRIGVDNNALGFLGGFTGNFIADWLKQENIAQNFTRIEDDTRINIKLKAESETEINGLGPAIHTVDIADLKSQLTKISQDDIVVLSGSAPASLPSGFYQKLIQLVKEKQAEFVIDTTGQDLMNALTSEPLLVKPNNHELAEAYQTTFNSIADIVPYGKKLLVAGAKNAIISMAGDGALLFTNEGVYQSNVLKRPLKNSVGAGDSMIAGFIGEYSQSQDAIAAFKWGVACGSATAFSDDLAQAPFIKELLAEVVVEKIAD
ncbi:1-phosphofructokinase [Enterococcus dispar]|uniref:Tagatose-6-phosphate kinase n=1 Tax=Enterococcus dispar ATCC 51266 TaxID=1139219 RepID=S1N7Y8_9ENTE|nr:1-phosphofructokinase [Enterococcus dispar]EOT43390.1 1-phosphofructokinase [Enterococcus dispar ATCC 51266]EOW85162.1 1-phosphofructokinase [Enterococcus dispar ATCC 51266]WCG33267.1 1-phosphofructokinase [Enterococcus dispar]